MYSPQLTSNNASRVNLTTATQNSVRLSDLITQLQSSLPTNFLSQPLSWLDPEVWDSLVMRLAQGFQEPMAPTK